MLVFKCDTLFKRPISALTPFQGELKKRTDKDIDDLAESLKIEGMLMPIAVWEKDTSLFILDGHGRYQAIIKIALTDPSVLTQDLPLITVQAETEEEARKALLQITSTYGKVSKKGVVAFTATIPEYKAPIINMAMKIKTTAVPKGDGKQIVRLRVPKDKLKELVPILTKIEWIEIY